MNFIKIVQFTFILFAKSEAVDEVASMKCEVIPLTDPSKVHIDVYINGGTDVDQLWLSRFCGWRDEGFDYDKYAPVTKVGAEMTCDEDICPCPNDSNKQADCTATFQNVCAAVELGDAEYKNFLCCTEFTDPTTQFRKGFDKCVSERPQLKEKIDACLAKVGAESPQEIALKNAKEVTDKEVINVAENEEPFFFFEGKFSKCINVQAYDQWMQTICSLLDQKLAHSIPLCKTAMAW